MSVGAVRCQEGTVCVMKGLWVSGGGVGQCGYQKGTVVCQEGAVVCPKEALGAATGARRRLWGVRKDL